MRVTKEELKLRNQELQAENVRLTAEREKSRILQKDYDRIENRIQALRGSLIEEFKAFLECQFLNHAERRGVERYFIQRIDRALLDILSTKYLF